MESFKMAVLCGLVGLALPAANQKVSGNGHNFNAQRGVDGGIVYGSSNLIDRKNVVENGFGPKEAADEDLDVPAVGNLQSLSKMEDVKEDPGLIDSFFGQGVQSRIVGSLNGWVVQKAKNNPGCVERFVCETYRAGESLTGIPYFAMSVTNAAVSFMVADLFGSSVNIKEITSAARHGRTIGSCHTMKCDFMDGQLRALGNYFEMAEDFFSSIYNSVASSINIGK